MSSRLTQLIYTSKATSAFNVDELSALAKHARQNNAEMGVTGILIYSASHFMQLIEGDEVAIEALFNAIERDMRHEDVTAIMQRPINKRSFPHWDMNVIHHRHGNLAEKIDSIQAYIDDGEDNPNVCFDLLCEFIIPDQDGEIAVQALK